MRHTGLKMWRITGNQFVPVVLMRQIASCYVANHIILSRIHVANCVHLFLETRSLTSLSFIRHRLSLLNLGKRHDVNASYRRQYGLADNCVDFLLQILSCSQNGENSRHVLFSDCSFCLAVCRENSLLGKQTHFRFLKVENRWG